jgi:hypothetical protein
MPDERREFHKIRPASHTLLSVNCLYQMNDGKRKGESVLLRRRAGSRFKRNTRSLDFARDDRVSWELLGSACAWDFLSVPIGG